MISLPFSWKHTAWFNGGHRPQQFQAGILNPPPIDDPLGIGFWRPYRGYNLQEQKEQLDVNCPSRFKVDFSGR